MVGIVCDTFSLISILLFCTLGELLRKKRREKDGHKDPILIELGRLQEDVMAQLTSLRTEHQAAEKKHEELVKVATILGLDHKNLRSSGGHECTPSHSKSKEPRSPEKYKSASITPTTQVDLHLLLVGKPRKQGNWQILSSVSDGLFNHFFLEL